MARDDDNTNPFKDPPSNQSTNPFPAAKSGGSSGGGNSNPSPNPFGGSDGGADVKPISQPETKPQSGGSSDFGPTSGSSGGANGANPFVPAPAGKEYKQREDPAHTCSEVELKEWAAELKERDDRMGDYQPPNWPSWPKPCARVAIDLDIPTHEERNWIHQMYYCWIANCFALFWNFICVCAYVHAEDRSVEVAVLGTIYWLFGMPAAFYFWFRLAYVAAETASNFKYLCTLIIFGIAILFWGAVCVGVGDVAMVGVISMIELFDDGYDTEGILAVVGLVMYTALIIWMCWLWCRGKLLYSQLPEDNE